MAEFLLETLWVFLLFFIIPIILFVGLYRMGKFLINLINKKIHKQFSSSWAYLLLIPLPLFFVLFFAGGCSFKYIDPQYYKFRNLCNTKAKRLVLDRKIYETAKLGEKFSMDPPNEKIENRIKKISFENIYKKTGVAFYEYETYFYYNYGIFLKGDEGAGWHWENKEILDCEPEISYQGNNQ